MDNTTLTLIVYLISTFGLAYVLGHSKITQRAREVAFDLGFYKRNVRVETAGGSVTGYQPTIFPLRWLVMLVECPACLGFWVGLACGWRLFHVFSTAVVLGFFTCSTNFMLGRWTGIIANPRAGE